MSRYSASSCGRCGSRVWSSDSSGQCGRCKSGLNDDLKDCGICLGPVKDRVRYAKISNESWDNECCSHSGNFCRGCLQQYLRSQLSDGCWNIRCPSVKCQYLLVEADMKRIFSVGTSEELGIPDKQECNTLLDKYTKLRTADYGAHLRTVLCIPDAGIGAASDTSSSDASADLSDSSDSDASGSRGGEELCLDAGFGTWALQSCQACPRCLVIIRKETGCNNIQCRCGSTFCYGCGAPNGSSGAKDCVCHGESKPSLAKWLRHSGGLSTNASVA